MTRRQRFLLTVSTIVDTVVTAVLLVVAATDDEPAATGPVPDGELVPSPLEPLVLPDKPKWTVDDATGAQVLYGAALVYGDGWAKVLDTRTGKARWTLTDDTDLSGGARWHVSDGNHPRLVDSGPDVVMVTEYRRTLGDGRQEDGLVALSAADGQVLWLAPTTRPYLASAGPSAALRVADSQVAVATVVPGDDPHTVQRQDLLQVLAIDLATGARRWTGAGAWPVAIAGDTLVSTYAPRHDPGQLGRVATFDLRTGAPGWARDDRTEALVAAKDVVVVRSATELAVLDAATGRKIADIGDPTRAHCVTDGYDSIVCDADETLDLYRVLDHAVTTIPTDADAEAVIRDRVFVTTTDDDPRHLSGYAVAA